jgi:CMP/dCMP kinase
MAGPLIVIDGPAGAGKSTVARTLAARIGARLLDTGAIYRSLALLAQRRGIAWDDGERLGELAAALRLEFRSGNNPAADSDPGATAAPAQEVWIVRPEPAPVEVTDAIRSPDISEGASRVSAHPQVRAALLEIQRGIAASAIAAGGCVAEGRDMGTVVFPDAAHKFFLTASSRTRAARRHLELAAKGDVVTPEQVAAELELRDQRDSSREAAPLQQADDAVLIDSSALDVDGVVDAILAMVRGPGDPSQ